MTELPEARKLIERMFYAALDAADPVRVVSEAIEVIGDRISIAGMPFDAPGKIVMVAIGKASEQMAAGAVQALGDRIDTGHVITKEGHSSGRLDARFQVWESGHPVPNQTGADAARATITALQELGPDDAVLALISGGGSALFEAPSEHVSLDDVAYVTEKLLSAGAPIQDLNAVRIPLSAVKGGRLRRSTRASHVATLILSDVLGNDPQVVASGPTVSGDLTVQDAMRVLRKYGLDRSVPQSIIDALHSDFPVAGEEMFSKDVVAVVSDNAAAVEAAAVLAAQEGLPVEIVWSQQEGEASVLGRKWVESIGDCCGPIVRLGGGEATVTVSGSGAGGRNTEFVLAAALELERKGMDEWVVASLATDGQDAMTGAAGAIVSAATIRHAVELGLDPETALDQNDTAPVLEKCGALLITGPTGTNVNDLYFAVRLSEGR